MILLLSGADSFTDEDFAAMQELLPPLRREKTERYVFKKDRILSASAYILLMKAIYGSGLKAPWSDFEKGKFGKPHFTEVPLEFNISHCSNTVACVVSNHECGIDVQDKKSTETLPERKIFSESERALIAESENKSDTLTMLWTRKEAYCKYLGCGLKDMGFLKNCLEECTGNAVMRSHKISDDTWLSVCGSKEEKIITVSAFELMQFTDVIKRRKYG